MSGWHSLKSKEVFHRLGTEGIGLSQKEAQVRWLVLATTGCIILQLVIHYTPLNRLFHVVPLGLFEWLILLLGAGISWILAVLITKYVVRYTH